MKKFYRAVFALCIITALAVPAGLCGAEEASSDKTLILYYSHTGNTKAASEALQKELGADIQEVRDLSSRDSGLSMAGAMLKTIMGMQTNIEPETVDFAPYDTVIIAAPIWASKFGLAMRTFVERNSFEGKQVIIFITADKFVAEKYQNKHKALVEKSGGAVIGHFQVHATDEVDGEKVPRSQVRIVEETLKLIPDVKACILGKK
jgi:flavodoxin